MSAITVGGDLVHYEVLGRGGRPVILIHGWIGSWRYWIPTMRQLQMKFRVYAIDLFGFGDSGKNPSKYPIAQQVAMLDEFMKQLGLTKAAILAHGLGTQIAIEYAKLYPDRIARMLLSSAPLFDPGDLDTRVPAGKRVLLTPDSKQLKPLNIPKPATQPTVNPTATPGAVTQVSRPVAPSGDIHIGGGEADDPAKAKTVASTSRETIPNPNVIDREKLRQAAMARMAEVEKKEETAAAATPVIKDNPLKTALGSDTEALLVRCFKKSDTEYEKFQADVVKADNKVLEHTATGFDAGSFLDSIRMLPMPVVLIHGGDDPVVTPPGDAIWDYLTADKDEDALLPVPMESIKHFPMLESDNFQRLVGMFLEMPQISKIELKERWRRRSR